MEDLLKACVVTLLLASCAHAAPRTTPVHAIGATPGRDEVVALMKELNESVLQCTPSDTLIMAKVTLDGQTGRISAVEGRYEPRYGRAPDDRHQPLSGASLECLRGAMLDKPAIYFRDQDVFTVSYPFGH